MDDPCGVSPVHNLYGDGFKQRALGDILARSPEHKSLDVSVPGTLTIRPSSKLVPSEGDSDISLFKQHTQRELSIILAINCDLDLNTVLHYQHPGSIKMQISVTFSLDL